MLSGFLSVAFGFVSSLVSGMCSKIMIGNLTTILVVTKSKRSPHNSSGLLCLAFFPKERERSELANESEASNMRVNFELILIN